MSILIQMFLIFPSNNMHLPAQPMRSSTQIHLVTELGMITHKPKHRLL